MMKTNDSISMQQIQKKMQCYQEIFEVVRLLDGETLEQVENSSSEAGPQLDCHCYSYWGKTCPCKNCTSLKAYNEKSRQTKLEFKGAEIYQVISCYLEIEGHPYILEMAQKMDEDTLVDAIGHEELVCRLDEIFHKKYYQDILTGMYNRRYYEDEIKNRNMSAGVAMIDIDDFKLYNDTFGHLTGDMALSTVSRVIQKQITTKDLLIRYGGDEFVLICPDMDKAAFTQKLEQIREKVHETTIPGYTQIQLSLSIGGAMAEQETMEEVIGRADRMMYRAKNRKNMVFTENDMENEQKNRKTGQEDPLRQQILIVDDSEMNREILTEMLKNDYRILEAENGKECVEILQQYGTGIALVLLDIVMPVMDGFEVLNYMSRKNWIEDIPVVMISSEDAITYIRRAYELGVSDYISRPFDAKVVYRRVCNTIKLYARQRRLIALVTRQINEKEKSNELMIEILSHIVEFRNAESGHHVKHIHLITQMLLEQLIQKTDRYNLSGEDMFLISMASALHDIGKIGIDDRILNKPGRLTKEEFDTMKKHTLIGAQMLKKMDDYQDEKLIKFAYQICRWHHERYDGRGYPDALKEDEIPIAAQVVSLADVYDALTSDRVYKKAYSHEVAMQMINKGECGTFNPILLECLMNIQDKIKKMTDE